MADEPQVEAVPRDRNGVEGGRRRGTPTRAPRDVARRTSPQGWPKPGRVLGGVGRSRLPGAARSTSTPPWSPTRDQLELVASLLESGVSVEDAFLTLARMARSRRTRTGAGAIARRIEQGGRIADALQEVGAPPHVTALVEAGERTGRAADALRGAALLAGRMEDLRTTLGRALVYPAVILGVGVAMLLLITLTVVPQLERTFLDLGGELPLPTRVVIGVSDAVRSVWFLMGIATVSILLRPLRAGVGRVGLGRRLRGLPVVRRFHTDVSVTVIARLVATMLAGGVPFVDALSEAARTLAPGSHRESVLRAMRRVEQGGSAFDDDGLGPLLGPVDGEILAVAERTGLLTEQWRRVAERRGQALDERVARLGTALEPVLVVVVGAIVGGAVIALYLPTFRVLDLI